MKIVARSANGSQHRFDVCTSAACYGDGHGADGDATAHITVYVALSPDEAPSTVAEALALVQKVVKSDKPLVLE